MDFRNYFDLDKKHIHLNNAGCTPLTKRAAKAILTATQEHSQLGYHAVPKFTKRLAESKLTVANFLGTKPEYIAMTQNCATAISMVAQGLSYKKDDEILTWDQEYPSNAYCWYEVAKKHQAKVVALKSEKNYEMNLDLMLEHINKRTRVVAISWVQSVAGTIIDLKPLLQACEKVGAWLVVDAFQGLGALPFKMSDYPGIVVTTGTQKWLCGPLGHAYLAFSDDRYRELNLILQGALTFGGSDVTIQDPVFLPTAARFEPGTPLLLTAFATAASISCIEEFGIENIRTKNILLRDRLIRGLDELDAQIFGTRDSQKSAPHVTFIPRPSSLECQQSLLEKNISYVTKAGGFRLSPHAFNTEAEIDEALSCFKGK